MLDKHIDPPCDRWEEERDLQWIDDLYEEWSEKQCGIDLHNYECRIYNELDRKIRV